MSVIRKPAVAGTFYPENPDELKNELKLLLSLVQSSLGPKNITGVVSPHAGYIYSGRTAAYAFNLLKNKNFKTVIIISPSHREYFAGNSIYDGDAYETPLGQVPLNKELIEKIITGSKSIFAGKKGHTEEHAIEVEIPFLQFVLSDFSIVPIVMGDQNREYVDELANQLARHISKDTVMVASSDLSHYHNKNEAEKLDSIIEKNIADFNYDELMDNLERRVCEACGGGPIAAMMKASHLVNKNKSRILHRSDSSDTSGDRSQVVGYLSAVIYGE